MNDGCYEQLNDALRARYPRDEDLVQETLKRLKEKFAAGVRIEGDVERFALGIARNVRKEFLRNKSQLHRSMETTQEDVAEPPAIEMEELQALLQKELSRTERELFWSYYLSGTADRAKHRRKLAAKLEIEPEALRKRVSRLLERLRNARKKKTS